MKTQLTREEVRSWMKEFDHSRPWLMQQCQVAKPTVDAWFSTRDFPAKAILIIQRLMADDHEARKNAAILGQTLTLDFSEEETEMIAARAKKAGVTPKEWVIANINRVSELDLDDIIDDLRLIVERRAQYRTKNEE